MGFQTAEGQPHGIGHDSKKGIVVVPSHGMNDDVKKGTEKSILKQAGLE